MKRRYTPYRLISLALRGCECDTPEKHLRLRVALVLKPNIADAVLEYVRESTSSGTVRLDIDAALSGSGIDPDTLERILQLLVEYLPQIIEIILELIDNLRDA